MKVCHGLMDMENRDISSDSRPVTSIAIETILDALLIPVCLSRQHLSGYAALLMFHSAITG